VPRGGDAGALCCDVAVATPRTRYARAADGVTIAFQTLGEGPIDVVLLRAWFTNLEHDWDERVLARVFGRFGSFGRLILFDRRGTGLSDPIGDSAPSLEARMDDLTAVLDAVGSQSVALVGLAEAATSLCCLYAATYPARVSALVLYDPQACGHWEPDYPWAATEADVATDLSGLADTWGELDPARETLAVIAASRSGDQALVEWLAASQRRSASPRAARALYTMAAQVDVRAALPAISTKTLVIHRGGAETPLAESKWIASQIPSSRLLELPGPDHMLISGDTDNVVDAIEQFLTGQVRTAPALDRVLATLLFTDIVTSTEELAERGDHDWADLIRGHHQLVRTQLANYRGREIDTAGDGFFAAFDGPARAVRCAQQVIADVSRLGLHIRAGVHSGECQIVDGKPTGLAVVVAARVMSHAQPDQVLVTSTVRDLAAGSGIDLTDAGSHQLKGIPDRWQLFSATRAS
jgi:class 3 adenylate cyclase